MVMKLVQIMTKVLCGNFKIIQSIKYNICKTFYIDWKQSEQSDHSERAFVAGYFNTTSALTRVQFKFSSGNIDSGVIKLYGIS
jgi:hypothetical protein